MTRVQLHRAASSVQDVRLKNQVFTDFQAKICLSGSFFLIQNSVFFAFLRQGSMMQGCDIKFCGQ